jgi:DNA polymerase
VWNEEDECWEAPPGAAESGLELVGVKNYVNHPTFKVLCLSYDILDGQGVSLWTPWDKSPPFRLLRHVALGGKLAGWNIGQFEFEVWNSHCVKTYGWPPLLLEQLVCDMAHARAWALPGKLANAGEVLRLAIQKDKTGSALIKKFCEPRQPTKKNKEMWNEPDAI